MAAYHFKTIWRRYSFYEQTAAKKNNAESEIKITQDEDYDEGMMQKSTRYFKKQILGVLTKKIWFVFDKIEYEVNRVVITGCTMYSPTNFKKVSDVGIHLNKIYTGLSFEGKAKKKDENPR